MLPRYSYIPFQISHDGINGSTKFRLPRHDAGDLGVECFDVYGLAGVFLLDIGGDGDVVAVLGNVAVLYQLGKVKKKIGSPALPRRITWYTAEVKCMQGLRAMTAV